MKTKHYLLLCVLSALLFCVNVNAEEDSPPNIKFFEITNGRLAFTLINAEQRHIHVLDFATLTVEQLTKTTGRDEWPAWSPDGRKLAFASDASGDQEIYVINYDGTGLTRLTKNAGPDTEPCWSPDGKKIVFSSSRGEEGRSLYVMDADGGKQERLAMARKKQQAINGQPKWSPRGNEIIFTSNEDWPGWDIGLLDLKEGKAKILTLGYQSFQRASWSPDGGSFVLSYGTGEGADLWEFQKGGKTLKALLLRPGKNYDATWTDDGRRLFFAGELTPGKGDFQLFIWDKAKGQTEQVLESKGAVRYLAWTSLPSLSQLEKDIKRQVEKAQP